MPLRPELLDAEASAALGGKYRLRDPLPRLMSKVQRVESGCWEWTARVMPCGYGKFTVSATGTIYAHIWAYRLLVGPIPEGLELDHLCRNRKCVNPDHLEPVTHQVNSARGEVGWKTGAMQRAKTHCPKGHEYSPENTYFNPRRERICRQCNNAAQREYQRRKKETQRAA